MPIAVRPESAVTLYVKDGDKFTPVKAVDLSGCTINCGEKDKFAALTYGGDLNSNSTPDFTATTSVRLPFFGVVSRAPETRDLPVDQALAMAQAASGALVAVPGVGTTVAGVERQVIGMMRAVFRKF